MTLPAQIPDSPQSAAVRPNLQRLIRKVAPLPAAGPGDACLEVLTHGDDVDEYLRMRAMAHNFAASPEAFQPVLADWLATESWEFNSQRLFRSAARNLQISDDFEKYSNQYQNIDNLSRQCLAVQALAANPAQREISRDADRAFRRALQLHKSILRAARLGK